MIYCILHTCNWWFFFQLLKSQLLILYFSGKKDCKEVEWLRILSLSKDCEFWFRNSTCSSKVPGVIPRWDNRCFSSVICKLMAAINKLWVSRPTECGSLSTLRDVSCACQWEQLPQLQVLLVWMRGWRWNFKSSPLTKNAALYSFKYQQKFL